MKRMLEKIKKLMPYVAGILSSLLLLATVLLYLEVVELRAEIGEGSHQEEEEHAESSDGPAAETHESTHSFGKISKGGGTVQTVFEIENHGKGTLEILDISTSCGCTSAVVDKESLEFNEVAYLTVTFDPGFHTEPDGVFERTVYVKTNDENLPEMEFDISVEIIN